MYLSELTTYKTTLLKKLCSSQEIVRLLSCGHEIQDAGDLLYKQIYPYAYMPDIKTETNAFICCDVEIPRLASENDLLKYTALHVYVLVHKSLMSADSGTRLDLLADQVDRLLNNNRDFGLGCGLKLVSLKRFMPNEEYYGVELYYEGCDMYSPGNSMKT